MVDALDAVGIGEAVASGGHFAAHKAPNELVGDVRAFYRPLRWSTGDR